MAIRLIYHCGHIYKQAKGGLMSDPNPTQQTKHKVEFPWNAKIKHYEPIKPIEIETSKKKMPTQV